MPNRILKESICCSPDIDELTELEEIFFYRLIVNCDDYGILDARSKILKAKLFPLKENITVKKIENILARLESLKMIILYEYKEVRYLKMSSWEKHQQVRAKRSKYPTLDTEGVELITDEIKCNQEITNVPVIQSNPIRIQSESNPYSEQEIFDLWNESKTGIQHKELTKDMKQSIKNAIKKYGIKNIELVIKRLSEAYNDKSYFYSTRWNLEKFMKQDNGVKNWLDEGQEWNRYLDQRGENIGNDKEDTTDPYAEVGIKVSDL